MEITGLLIPRQYFLICLVHRGLKKLLGNFTRTQEGRQLALPLAMALTIPRFIACPPSEVIQIYLIESSNIVLPAHWTQATRKFLLRC
jgi:hypothetical protein